jgi:hypothetical protein
MLFTVLNDGALPSTPHAQALLRWALQQGDAQVQGIHGLLAQGIRGRIFTSVHGDTFPVELEDLLEDFLASGGSLLHVGGQPFENAVTIVDGTASPCLRTLGQAREHSGHGPLELPFDLFRARLGINCYFADSPAQDRDLEVVVDPQVGHGMPTSDWTTVEGGIAVNHTVPLAVADPRYRLQDNRAYMARPRSRRSRPIVEYRDPTGRIAATAGILVLHERNPYRLSPGITPGPWALLTAVPSDPAALDILLDGLRGWLDCPAYLRQVPCPSPLLLAAESTTVQVQSSHELPPSWQIVACKQELSPDDLRWSAEESVAVIRDPATRSWSVTVSHRPDVLVEMVTFRLLDQVGQTRDVVSISTANWSSKIIEAAPAISATDRYWRIDAQGTSQRNGWLTGTNWQDPDGFAWSFVTPDPARIARDAEAMRGAGMHVVRPHFFTDEWFAYTAADAYRHVDEQLYSQFDTGPELSERTLRAFGLHLLLFNAYGLSFMPTVYTNVGPSMGNPSHWMGTSRAFVIESCLRNQEVMAAQLQSRYGDAPGLIWDLLNEPDTGMNLAGDWARRIRQSLADPLHSVGVGTSNVEDSIQLGENVDYHSVHGNLRSNPHQFYGGKSALLQEAHNPAAATSDGDAEQDRELNLAFARTLRHGGSGVLPWNWGSSHVNWRHGGGWVDYWDYTLGCAVHEDGTARRAQSTLANWSQLMRELEFIADPQLVYIHPKRVAAGRGGTEYLRLIDRLGYRARGVNDHDFSSADLTGCRIVIAPYSAFGFRASTYRRLRDWVSRGGHCFGHLDNIVLDEDGAPDATRAAPRWSGEQPHGNGWFHWILGWNFDDDAFDPQVPVDLNPFVESVLELLDPPDTRLQLQDGHIQFEEKGLADARTMVGDWNSATALPRQVVPVTITVNDLHGRPRRVWTIGADHPIEYAGGHVVGRAATFALFDAAVDPLFSSNEPLMFEGLRFQAVELYEPTPHGSWTRIGSAACQSNGRGTLASLAPWQSKYWLKPLRSSTSSS